MVDTQGGRFLVIILLLLSISKDNILVVLSTGVLEEEFKEELFIKRLPTGHLGTFFQFITLLESTKDGDECECINSTLTHQ